MATEDGLKLDYEQTCQQIRAFTDIRFKLLAFVPTLTGAAVALLGKQTDPWTALAVGLLGLFVVLGIVFYEIRNTVLYDAAIHRAKWLEVSFDLPVLTYGRRYGGTFNERPARPTLFEGAPLLKVARKVRASLPGADDGGTMRPYEEPALHVWHDRALALVYGAALGGWVYTIAVSSLTLMNPRPSEAQENGLAAVLLAVILAFWVVREWHLFGGRRDKPKPMAWLW